MAAVSPVGEYLWSELARMCEESARNGRRVTAVRMNEAQRSALTEWVTHGQPVPDVFGAHPEPTAITRIVNPHTLAVVDVLDGDGLCIEEGAA